MLDERFVPAGNSPDKLTLCIPIRLLSEFPHIFNSEKLLKTKNRKDCS